LYNWKHKANNASLSISGLFYYLSIPSHIYNYSEGHIFIILMYFQHLEKVFNDKYHKETIYNISTIWKLQAYVSNGWTSGFFVLKSQTRLCVQCYKSHNIINLRSLKDLKDVLSIINDIKKHFLISTIEFIKQTLHIYQYMAFHYLYP